MSISLENKKYKAVALHHNIVHFQRWYKLKSRRNLQIERKRLSERNKRHLILNNCLAFKQCCFFCGIETEAYRLLYWDSARALGCYTCRIILVFPRNRLNCL